MKKITTLLLAMGIVTISACATNEADMDAAKNDADMAKEKATMEADKAEANAEKMRMEAKKKAEQEKMAADQKRMEAEKKAEQERMQAEEAVAARTASSEMDTASSNSNNLVSTCTYGDQTRIITVVYDNDATDTACEVTYEKSTGVQTLWTANTDRDYCSERAAEFVQKQEGWGWSCTELK